MIGTRETRTVLAAWMTPDQNKCSGEKERHVLSSVSLWCNTCACTHMGTHKHTHTLTNKVCVGSFETIIQDNLYADYGDPMEGADWTPVFIKIWILISCVERVRLCGGEGGTEPARGCLLL